MNRIRQVVEDITTGNTKPIYFLMGEEAYYIDRISNYIEKNLLTEEEKGFNQVVLYGRDVTIEDVVSQAKRYPMMADKQVVVVKEAQDLSRTIDKLLPYAENPQPTTVLVICYKYKSLDKRSWRGRAAARSRRAGREGPPLSRRCADPGLRRLPPSSGSRRQPPP